MADIQQRVNFYMMQSQVDKLLFQRSLQPFSAKKASPTTPQSPNKLKSFFIKDIIDHQTHNEACTENSHKGNSAIVSSYPSNGINGDNRSLGYGYLDNGIPHYPDECDGLFPLVGTVFQGQIQNGSPHSASLRPLTKGAKKPRVTFSGRQLFLLETWFERKRYLTSCERRKLATELGVRESQIKIWFQNRRSKWKRQHYSLT